MPLYEYACSACHHHFEVRQRVTEPPETVCPSCGGAVKRVIHPVGIIFKGSGFYVTDNRKSSTGESSTAEKSSAEKAPASTSAETKSSAEKASTGSTTPAASGSSSNAGSKPTASPST
jgi:putative FmdB family regulatory protein